VIVWSLASYLGKIWAQRLLADHKSELEKTINEHQIKFARVFERQAAVISELYSLLHDLHRKVDYLHALTMIDYKNRGKEKCSEFYRSLSEAEDFFRRNRIYLSIEVCSKIEDFIKISTKAAGPFSAAHSAIGLTSEDGSLLDPKAELEKALPVLQDAIKQLEHDFRSVLGIGK